MNSRSKNPLILRFYKRLSIWLPGRKNILFAFILLTGGLAITITTAFILKSGAEGDARNRFDFNCTEIKDKIITRLHAHAQLLRSQASFIESKNDITRSEWRDIYNRQKIEDNLPGVLGVGFSLIIPPENLDNHIRKIRSEGHPEYSVKPEGKREFYTSIVYLEPFTGRNLRAFGYDMYTEPVRRKAMEIARDLDIPSLSGKIILVQETEKDVQPGTLMYVPVFRKGFSNITVEERRKSIIGWVYSPYRMNDLINGIIGNADKFKEYNIHLEIFDNENYESNGQLYDSKLVFNQGLSKDILFSKIIPISFYGHNWYLRFGQYDSGSTNPDYSKAWGVGLGGTFVTLLIFLLHLSLSNTTRRVRNLAEHLTQELRDSEGKYRTIFNNEIYAISIIDLETHQFLDVNERQCRLYGYSRKEFLSGMKIDDIGQDILLNTASIESMIVRGTMFIPLGYHKKKEGALFPVEIVGGTFKWKGKRVVFFLVHDITERIKAEEQLKKWAHVFENAKWGIVVGSADGKYIEMMNPAFASMLGYSMEELKGKPIAELFSPEQRNELVKNTLIAHQTGHHVWESFYRRKDGTPLPVTIDITAVKDDRGAVLYRVVNVQDITDRKMAENALKESEARFKNMFESHDACMLLIDPESGSIIDANNAAVKFYGYSKKTLLEMSIEQVNTMLPELTKSERYKALSEKQNYFVFPHKLADGEERIVEVHSSPIKYQDKTILFSIIHDITERKLAEKSVAALALRNQTLLQTASDGIHVLDETGNVTEVNEAFCKMLGYSREEMLSKNVADWDMKWSRIELVKKIDELMVNGGVFETRHLRKDGSIIEVEINSTGIILNDKKYLYAAARDVTERKLAEKALKESEEKFRLLLNSTAEAIYGLDLNGNCIFCNNATVRILGLADENEVLGKNMHDLIHHSHEDGSKYPQHDCKIYEAFLRGEGTHIDDEVLWKKDGTSFPAEYWSYPIYHENKIVGSVVTFIDITERKMVEKQLQDYTEELKESNETKDKLFSIIAHDLRGPFTGILGYSEILSGDYKNLTEEEKLTFISSIDQLSSNAYKLLENLLEWARIQTGRIIFAPEKLNLLPELFNTLALIKHTAQDKGIDFNYSIDNSLTVYADKNMLETVVRNLLSNAVKFTEPNGKIDLSVCKKDNRIEFTVSDTGVGIQENRIAGIFKIEKNKTTTGTASEKGSGLGLIICKDMVEKHGGHIKVESTTDKGTTFTFSIPDRE